MADIASLVVGVDASSAAPAAKALDSFTSSAQKAEAATTKLQSTQSRMAAEMQRIGQQIQSAGGWDQWTQGMEKAGVSSNLAQQRLFSLGQQSKLTARDLSFMGFQFQDVMVTAAMGMNPLMIALQQGTQLIQPFQLRAMGLGASLKAVFSGIATFLTDPLMLAVLAIGAVGLAIQKLYTWWTGSTHTVEDSIKSLDKAIREIKGAYDDAKAGAQSYTEEAIRQAERLRQKEIDDAKKTLASRTASLASTAQQTFTGRLPTVATGSGEATVEARNDLTKNLELLRQGKESGAEFVDVLLRLRNVPGISDEFKRRLDEVYDAFKDILGLAQKIDEINPAFEKAAEAARNYADALKDVTGLVTQVGAVPERLIETRTTEALTAAQERYNQQIKQGMGEEQARANQEAAVSDAISRRVQALQSLADADAESAAKNKLAIDGLKARTIEERVALAVAQQRLEFQSKSSEGGAEITPRENTQLEQTRLRTLAEENDKVTRAQKDRIDAMDQSVRAQQFEILTFGKTAVEIENLRTKYELLEAAKKAAFAEGRGGVISPEELAAINATADAMGDMTAKMESLKAGKALTDIGTSGKEFIADQQLQAAQIGLTAEEASRLQHQYDLLNQARQAGIILSPAEIQNLMGVADAMTAAETKARDLQKQYDFTKEVMDSFTSSMSAGLRQGKGLWDSFADGVVSALGKIADKLMEMATNDLLTMIFGGASTAGTGSTGGGIVQQILSGLPQLTNAVTTNATTAATTMATSAATQAATQAAGTVITGTSSSILEASRKAIGTFESGMNYGALGPVLKNGDQAIGAYQVMASNVPSWTKSALGTSMTPGEFRANPAAQDTVFNNQFGGYLQKYGVGGAGQAWFGGPGSIGKGDRTDVLGTSVSKYQKIYEDNLQKFSSSTSNATQAVDKLATGSTLSGDALTNALKQASNGVGSFANILASIPSAMSGSSWFKGLSSVFGGGAGALGFMSGISPAATSDIISGSWGLFQHGDVFTTRTNATIGEVGPEAVVPLQRDASGRLGIANQSGPNGGSARKGLGSLTVKVVGARGNREIQDMVQQGIREGLAEYDTSVLPTRVNQVVNDSRVR